MSEVTIVVISTDLETKEYVIHIVKNEVNILPIVLVSLLLIVSIIALYLYKKLVNRKKMEPKLHIKKTIYTENKIKDDFGIKSRCLIEDEEVTGPCTVCGRKAKTRLYIGRQY